MDFSKLKTTDKVDVKGKRVLVRADLNVPVQNGQVTDATRLERIVPGLAALMGRGAKVIVTSHFGRPKGRDTENSLRPVAEKLAALVDVSLKFADDCIGPKAEQAVATLAHGEMLVLENTRFHKGEENNDPAFVEALAKLGDLFVNDAFSAAHRAHASTEGLAHLLPAYAGPLMMEELDALRLALEEPKHPVAAIVGGAKVSTKIPLLKNLSGKVDKLIIGGGMANTFLLSQGINVGKSLAEPNLAGTAREVIAAAKAKGCEIVLPTDVVIAREFKAGVKHDTVPINKVPSDAMILDIGAKSIWSMTKLLDRCATLLWNGPMGAFEIAPFGDGTFALAREVAQMTKRGTIVSVAGGGDTVAALNAAGVAGDFTYVSTAGGAFLEWLEGSELPGVVALTRG